MRWLDGILTQWTGIWVLSGSWWWTGRPGMLQFMGLQRVGHNWATELNSLSFCLSEKLLVSPSILNGILAGYSILSCRFFPFNTLNISCHSLLACRVSIERSAVILMGIPLYVICCFPLAAFHICSLCLIFVSWLICVLVCFSLGLSSMGFSLLHGLEWLFPSLF